MDRFDPDGALNSTQLVVVGFVPEDESTHSELKQKMKMVNQGFILDLIDKFILLFS